MAEYVAQSNTWRGWLANKLFLGQPFREYVRGLVTPFNIVAAVIVCVGLVLTAVRFTQGLEATTNLTNNYPWGLWIGFDVLCGVALAAGGFVLASTVHLFGLRDYYPLVRPAILTGFWVISLSWWGCATIWVGRGGFLTRCSFHTVSPPLCSWSGGTWRCI